MQRKVAQGLFISVIVIISLFILFSLSSGGDPCPAYEQMAEEYKWAFQTQACENELTNPTDLQNCYECIYHKQISDYSKARFIMEYADSAGICEKLEDGDAKSFCLDSLEFAQQREIMHGT
jgi:hypothetical protein